MEIVYVALEEKLDRARKERLEKTRNKEGQSREMELDKVENIHWATEKKKRKTATNRVLQKKKERQLPTEYSRTLETSSGKKKKWKTQVQVKGR